MPVAQPQGLDASPNDGSKVQNSVRGILYTGGNLYVADEPGNALKIYDGTSGDYKSSLTLAGPIHLLGLGTKIYVSCGGKKKPVLRLARLFSALTWCPCSYQPFSATAVSQVFRE